MFPIVAIVAVLLAVLTIMYVFGYHSVAGESKIMSGIPGLAASDPENGNRHEIAAAGSLHEFLVNLHNEYGPICSFWYGQQFTVSVASPDLFKCLKAVTNRPVELFRLLEPLMGVDSISYVNGQNWLQRRKATDPAWSHDMLNHFCETFNEVGEELVAKLSKLSEKDHIPLCQHTLVATLKGLSQTSFGNYFKDDIKCQQLKQNYDICWNEIESRMDGSMPTEGSLRQKQFEESLKKMKDMVSDIIEERKKNPPKPHERAFIDVCMENTDIFTDDMLMDDAMTYMIAGFHTSGYLLAWTLYYLTLNNDVQDKVYEEVMTVVGPKASIAPEDIANLRYIKQVMNETLRLGLVTTWSAKVQYVDTIINGYNIPKGTPIIAALGVLHQDEKMWPNPTRFDPDRFNPENVNHRHPYLFHPFGLPGRICPGYRFAFYELSVFLAILVRKFKWSLVDGQEVKRKFSLVTTPKEEIWVHIDLRE